ncbi:hypothetical protein AX14_000496 [Amanita brunnescens Koide BX004]|nr:hypothetical protein AX14_000496 [Amanita brunnescens Koide BX004]
MHSPPIPAASAESRAGKSSLINALFKASLADQAGTAKINEEFSSPYNKHLIIHDSEGYEPGNDEKFDVLEKFITGRSHQEPFSERLHAIWLRITSPLSGGQIFETGDELVFKLNQNKMPIIVVFTKFDLFVAKLNLQRGEKDRISLEFAERHPIPYIVAAISLPDTLQRLAEITMQTIVETSSPSRRVACGSDKDLSNSTQKINSLINENEMTDSDKHLDQTRPTIPLLLSILRFEQSANSLVVNLIILDLLHKVLDLQDYGTIIDELQDPVEDVELLTDFILHALRNDSFSDSGIPDANRRARGLMFKLINRTDVALKSLSITNVKIDSHHGMGELARVYRGKYQGQQVALKLLDKEGAGKNDFCRQALAWRSLVHKFILPLVGIFREKSQQFLVSPFMANGTLTEWRKNQPSLAVPDIHRMMLEVAEGVQYIHSEGIVHGDLCGENVLLDSDFHCQIAGFGLARHSDASINASATFAWLNFPAPELLGNCDKCGESNCECRKDHEISKIRTTKETDVCAFGCLYYLIFFDVYPFEGTDEFQVLRLVARGVRPDRLSNPIIEDDVWDIIQKSWRNKPSERLTMQQIVQSLVSATDARDVIQIRLEFDPSKDPTKAPAASSSVPVIRPSCSATPPSSPARATATSLSGVFHPLLASLNESTTRGSPAVNKVTLNLASKLLDLPDYTITASAPSVADIKLLLDFLLLLRNIDNLSNLGVYDANRKARKLMFKLISIADVIPKSLFIVDVKTEATMISMGAFGRVFRGEHKGQRVALKVIDKGHHDDSLSKDLCREAIAWRSFTHRSILPLLGIFEEKSQLFLVSPFIENGTLIQWRKQQERDVVEIHRMILEVAEGVQYLQSGGIVHGDLHGRNILVDSEFHCQIADFGTTQHYESTVARSTATLFLTFAAPELFGTCTACGLPECDDERHGDHNVEKRSKTLETDIYAFGCVYYSTFFDNIPFHDKNYFQVVLLVMNGARADRLESPGMEDDTWNLIQSCWEPIPSSRPTIDHIVKALIPST